jgi:predicted metal-binding protein
MNVSRRFLRRKETKMTQVAIIRCEKNMERCPLTNCLRCLREGKEGFANYDESRLVGIFACRCPGDNAVELARILKSKGAEAIHFCTCCFAKKVEGVWSVEEGGFCDHIDEIIGQVHRGVGIPCMKGTAHLPEGYEPERVA